jgi:hypothetical protein
VVFSGRHYEKKTKKKTDLFQELYTTLYFLFRETFFKNFSIIFPMSLSKVQKQIHNLDPKLREVSLLRKIPVVLSDSKAKYLENVVDFKRHPENKILNTSYDL